MAAADLHHEDQQAFVSAFLRDNVRHRVQVNVLNTSCEIVSFDIVLLWALTLNWREDVVAGRYAGDANTVHVGSPAEMQAAFEDYFERLFISREIFDHANAVIGPLPDHGLYQLSRVTVRQEAREFAWQHLCGTCHGSGSVTCGRCNGRGDVACSICAGSGRNQCVQCYGRGRIEYSETYYVGGQSHTRTASRPCYCNSGSVTCSSCVGRGRVRCSTCAGTGQVECSTCRGTGWLTAIRRMTVVADSTRNFNFDTSASDEAKQVFGRFSPDRLPKPCYSGNWDPAVTYTKSGVQYVMHARSRYLRSQVETNDGQTFPFKTFGHTLHVASGGGLVESLLADDRKALTQAAALSLRDWVLRPVPSFLCVARAAGDVLASRINKDLLGAAYGKPLRPETAWSVSREYQLEMQAGLKKCMGVFVGLLFRGPFIVVALLLALAVLVSARPWTHPITTHMLDAAAEAIPYTSVLMLMLIPAALFIVSRLAPALALRNETDEPILEAALLVRGKVTAKTAISLTFIAGLAYTIALALGLK